MNHLGLEVLQIASLVPWYMIIFFLCLVLPEHWAVLECFEAAVEGYCLLAFFYLIVRACGGWEKTIELMKKYPKKNDSNEEKELTTILWSCRALLIVRPILFIIKNALVAKTSNTVGIKVIQFITAAILVFAVVKLIRLELQLKEEIHHIKAMPKLLYVKGLVILYTLQNLVIVFFNGEGSGSRQVLLF